MQAAVVKHDPQYLHQRRQELQPVLDMFAKELYRIHCLIPFPGFKIDLETGKMETLPIPKEWQDTIDCVLKLRDEYIKSKFPEFYNKA